MYARFNVPEEYLAAWKSGWDETVTMLVNYSKRMYEVAGEANAELSKLTTRSMNKWNDAQIELIAKVAEQGPAGVDVALGAMKLLKTASSTQVSILNALLSDSNSRDQRHGRRQLTDKRRSFTVN